MMSLRMSLTVPLLFLIFISGVGAQDWGVTYSPNSICALKGSTVTMGCSYSYPPGHTVQTAFWTIAKDSELSDLSTDPEYSGRVQYLGNYQHDCRLSLRDVTESDQSIYYFRFITNKKGGKWLGAGGVTLSVTDLQVEGPERVMEGDRVTLTCKTTYSLTDSPSFTWYRNGAALSFSTEQLHLQSVSREDAGRYSCAVLDQNLHSPEVTLNVLYPPKSVSVFISPFGEIVEGSSVTLTCSSDGNPPVKYTWYKESSSVAKGNIFTLNKISSVNSGEYQCRSSNEHGQKYSDTVTLNVLYPPKSVSVSISPSGEIVEGSSVTLTCNSDGNPPVKYTWFKKEDKGVLQKSTHQIYSITNIRPADSGDYQCLATNTQGSRLSEYKPIMVSYPPKSVSVSISPSGEIVEGISVTLTCSSDGNPPVEYTWFNGSSSVATGKTFRLNKISSVNSGEYKCKCSNKHGDKYSAVTLNVLYPPKSVSVSISPSGEIVEGSSVTLTCSSDGNPPVQKYTWSKKEDKGVLQKWTGQIYSITNIRSADSGEYQCLATNTQGSQYSEYKPLIVLHAPKKVWMSISETALDGSVNLTCSSDGNPPVQNYTWFKEGGGSSPVGYGNSYSAVQSGSYYCVAQNRYGSQTAAAVPVTLKGDQSSVVYAAVGVCTACLLVIGVIFFVRGKRRGNSADGADPTQDNIYSTVGEITTVSDSTPGPDPSNQDDVQYATVVPRKLKPSSAVKASSSENDEEVQYATVQHRGDKVVKKPDGDDVQYASVRFVHTDASGRSTAPTFEDHSVIYSSVK